MDQKKSQSDLRKARLAKALKANLARRKARPKPAAKVPQPPAK